MAPKRPLGNPPPTNSDEEDSSDEEVEEEQPVEEEEEEEEEEEPPAKIPASEPEAAESDDQSDSDVDSDKTPPSPNSTDFTIKPIVSKTHSAKPNPPTSKKRPERSVETPTSPESSKKKKKLSESSGGGDVLGKRGAVQRVWSDDDEIAILNGMIEFESKNESDPCTDIVGFHEYIKDSVHADVSNCQLKDKIRRLRNRYQNNAVKGKNGEDPVFSKPHEHMSFQLSKKIWGDVAGKINKTNKAMNGEKSKWKDSVKEEESKKSKDSVKEEDSVIADGDGVCLSSYPSLKKSLDLMPENLRDLSSNLLCSVGSSKVKELDEEWKELNKKEFGLHLMKTQLFLDMTKALGFNQGNK